MLGQRYTTKDPTFLSWGLAPGKSTFASHENGGQWFSKIANLKDGSAPPAGTPGWMMNVGGGNRYALGEYHPANETWTTTVATATIDSGPNSNWECERHHQPPCISAPPPLASLRALLARSVTTLCRTRSTSAPDARMEASPVSHVAVER